MKESITFRDLEDNSFVIVFNNLEDKESVVYFVYENETKRTINDIAIADFCNERNIQFEIIDLNEIITLC